MLCICISRCSCEMQSNSHVFVVSDAWLPHGHSSPFDNTTDWSKLLRSSRGCVDGQRPPPKSAVQHSGLDTKDTSHKLLTYIIAITQGLQEAKQANVYQCVPLDRLPSPFVEDAGTATKVGSCSNVKLACSLATLRRLSQLRMLSMQNVAPPMHSRHDPPFFTM